MSEPTQIRDPEASTKGINMLLYGANGAGKTPFIANERTLILDADGGSGSAAGTGAKVWAIEEWSDMDDVYEYLRHTPDHPFDWVWYDGISIGQEKNLEGIMIDLVANRPHRVVYMPDKGEYGQNMNRMKQWIRHMAALPVNFGITAHEFRDEDPVTEETVVMPWIQGRNMPQTVCGYMSVIGYMEVIEQDGKDFTVIRFRKHKLFYARDRFDVLGDKQVVLADGVPRVTLPKITQMIQAKTSGGPAKKAPAKKAPGKVPAKKVASKRPAKRPATK